MIVLDFGSCTLINYHNKIHLKFFSTECKLDSRIYRKEDHSTQERNDSEPLVTTSKFSLANLFKRHSFPKLLQEMFEQKYVKCKKNELILTLFSWGCSISDQNHAVYKMK